MKANVTLSFDSVHKRYGDLHVLRGFSGEFQSGRVGALVGPNGAGKTTLLRIAAGFQHASSGTVSANRVLYYGGFDTLPLGGRIDDLRQAVGLPRCERGARKLRHLSRGELHAVGLDIAFEIASDVLLLDEPWTALEPDSREALSDRLRQFAMEHVVVCSSHDLDEVARVADDVAFLERGVARWVRREDEVFDRESLIRVYRESRGR